MTTLDLKMVGPIINAIIGILSSQTESIKLKLNNKNKCLEVNVYDKANSIEIVSKFETKSDLDNVQYFSMEPARLRAIINKRSAIKLRLDNNSLFYSYIGGKSKTTGKIEIEEHNSKFKFPEHQVSKYSLLNNLIFTYYEKVKLKPVFDNRDMFLYVRHTAGKLSIASADNLHVSLYTVDSVNLGDVDFDLTLPFKYVDIAKKFASYNDDKIDLIVKDKEYMFITPNTAFILPVISTEGSKININSITEHINHVLDNKLVTVSVITSELNQFLSNAIAIKESGKLADILIDITGKTLTYTIETSHGLVQNEIELLKTFDKKYQIKVSCAALQDLLSKVTGDKIALTISKNSLILSSKESDTERLILTTLGVI